MGKTRTIPKIVVEHGAKARIAKHHGCTGETVRRALGFHTNNELAVAIRRDAIRNYGGIEVQVPVR